MSTKKISLTVTVVLILITVLLVAGVDYFFMYNKHSNCEADTVVAPMYSDMKDYELSLIKQDLFMYDYLSGSTILTIIDALEQSSKRFPLVPLGLMHAVTRTESEYRFWINHPTVNVNVKGQRVTTNAIGMGGVIWEFWGDTLKYYNIAHSRSDLYLPDVGIKAQACVLSSIIKSVMSDSTTNENNIVSRVQSRYYGAYSDMYMGKMKDVTSDLWMKRMAKDIKDVYNSITTVLATTYETDADTVAGTGTQTLVYVDSASGGTK